MPIIVERNEARSTSSEVGANDLVTYSPYSDAAAGTPGCIEVAIAVQGHFDPSFPIYAGRCNLFLANLGSAETGKVCRGGEAYQPHLQLMILMVEAAKLQGLTGLSVLVVAADPLTLVDSVYFKWSEEAIRRHHELVDNCVKIARGWGGKFHFVLQPSDSLIKPVHVRGQQNWPAFDFTRNFI